jgi:hypothetical protein
MNCEMHCHLKLIQEMKGWVFALICVFKKYGVQQFR